MTYTSDHRRVRGRTAALVFGAFALALLLAVVGLVASSSTADAQAASVPCTQVFGGPVTPSVPVTQGECDALEAFYNGTSGDTWDDSTGWDASDPCGWFGVTCEPTGITELRFALGNGLAGQIPPEIGDLVNLQWLALNMSIVDGTTTLPPEIGNLTNLKVLSITGDGITGTFPPEVYNLTNLEWLFVSGTSMSGQFFSPAIANLTQLERLRIQLTDFSGEIPAEIGDLPNLSRIEIQDTGFSGAIPPEIGNLPLTGLGLTRSEFSGQIPAELANLSQLQSLRLFNNELTGQLPGELTQLTQLERLDVSRNNLTGTIPTEIGNMVGLAFLLLGDNNLTGPIPTQIGNLTDLESLGLHRNSLTGEVPSTIGNLVNLEQLSLFENNLSGALPAELGNLVNLVNFDAGDNDFTGDVPDEIWQLVNLTQLSLEDNQLTGPISPDVGNLTVLRFLKLGRNQFAGVVPDEIVNLTDVLAIQINGSGCLVAGPIAEAKLIEQGAAGSLNGPACAPEPDSATIDMFETYSLDVLTNDGVAQVAPIDSVTVNGPLALGAATVVPGTLAIEYTPTLDAAGTESFSYTVCSLSYCADANVVITINDTQAPVVTRPDDVTVSATGPNGAAVTYPAALADDNADGVIAADCVPASGTVFAIGLSAVSCTATDSAGNGSDAVTFTVAVVDTAPELVAPGDVSESATGPGGAIVSYDVVATDAVDGDIAADCLPASGTLFAIGDTTVTCNAVDSVGSSSGAVTFTVTVADDQAPVLTAPSDRTPSATNTSGVTVTYGDVIAVDNVDGDIIADCVPASGTVFPIGVTTVTCDASDEAGNVADSVTFTVTVIDTAPRFPIQPDISRSATGPDGAVVAFTITATDNVDGTIIADCVPASGTQFALGDTTVTCVATDSSGNTRTQSFTVTVADDEAPVLVAPGDVIVPAVDASGATVSYGDVIAVDNVDGDVIADCVPASGTLFAIGGTTVTCDATDNAGNLSDAVSFTVTVEELPVVGIPGVIDAIEDLLPIGSFIADSQLNAAIADLNRAQDHLDASPAQRSSAVSDLRRAIRHVEWAQVFGLDYDTSQELEALIAAQAQAIAESAIQDAIDRGGSSFWINNAQSRFNRGLLDIDRGYYRYATSDFFSAIRNADYA